MASTGAHDGAAEHGMRGDAVRPTALLPLVGVVGAESLALFAAAAWLLFGLVTAQVASAPATIMLVLLVAGGGFWLLRTAQALWRGRRWPRAAALTAQLFTILIAGVFIRPIDGWAALLVVVAALVAGFSLFREPVVDWTTQEVPADRL